jgi:hypothetical protein
MSLSSFVGALKRGVLAFHKETTFSAKATLSGFLVLVCLIVIGIISAEYDHSAKPVVRESQSESRGIDPALLAGAERGDAKAQSKLGDLYHNGQGVPQDYTQAAAWYRKAAEQGDAGAQASLGIAYYDGQGLPQDYEQAARWSRKAAEQGDAKAKVTLGLLCARGQGGLPADSVQANAWFREAAEQGDAIAQFDLGISYRDGIGLLEDHAQAATWFRKAAEQGNSGAKEQLDKILKEQQGNELLSYWPTTIRVDTDMDSFWLADEERICQTYPNDKGRIAVVACNPSGSHRDRNIPVRFWGDPDRNSVSDWKCRRESDKFVCRAID